MKLKDVMFGNWKWDLEIGRYTEGIGVGIDIIKLDLEGLGWLNLDFV